MANLNSNPNYVPTNLLTFIQSNYIGRLPTHSAWTFDGATQTGASNGTASAGAQYQSGPALAMPVLGVGLPGGTNFSMSFQSILSNSYTVQNLGDFTTTNWANATNFPGTGFIMPVAVPVPGGTTQQYFRIKQP